MSMAQPVRIALRLADSGYVGRILLGGLRAAHARKWIVSVGENAPAYMLQHGVRGIIGMASDRPAPAEYAAVGIPYVSVLSGNEPGCVGQVKLDHVQIAVAAAEHLLECGFRNFGYVGYTLGHGTTRRIAFENAVAPRARSMSVCPVAFNNTPEQFDAMLAWLHALPKPAGVFAADDPVGGAVTEVCQLGGVRVPADVAVVSVNDDGVRTLASEPELSSVRIPWERFGAMAVEMLEAHIHRRPDAPTVTTIQPAGIAVRGSSDISVLGDTEVAAAVAFITQNVHRMISVADVVDSTTVSRRLLERRFKIATGRTLLEQIRFARLERSRQMLAETTLRVSDIARACGFGSTAQFHRVFYSEVGMTPDAYRHQNREAAA